MEQLHNNCRLGKMSIFPKNWDAKRINKENLLFDWYIKYRFYDDNLHNDRRLCGNYELLTEFSEEMVKLSAIKLLANKI